MRVIAIEEHYARGPVGLGALPPDVQRNACDLGDARIADMDAAGIDVQVLSLTAPGAQGFPAADAVALAREENDWLAEAVSRHPDRLAAFAALPAADPAAAASELEHSVRRHGFKGALVNGMIEGRFLDDHRFWPIFECAEALRVPVYLHPGIPPPSIMGTYYADLAPAVGFTLATSAWGWHIETGLHVLRLVVAGVFDRFPGLQILVGHLGEALPFMLTRTGNRLPRELTGLPRTIEEYVREHVHLTTSGFFSVPPLLNALLEVGADRILFSVDYPFSTNGDGRAFLDSMPVSQADREKIAHANAESLLRL
jgi:predicted TIM-barrel fold metal-dependent hydrolase